MKGLHSNFAGPEYYSSEAGYRLLPMRFLRLDDSRRLVTGMAGDFLVMPNEEFTQTVMHELPRGTTYNNLKGRHLIADEDSNVYQELLAAKFRTRHSHLPNFTSLHLFVLTLRCDHSCQYCQVSRVSEDRQAFDMSEKVATRAIELMFQSPSPILKVEFQGGESLLNFDMLRWIVEEVKRRNDGRRIEFVITTNLSQLSEEILDFAEVHRIHFSTSLDGPEQLHNANRPRPNKDSWQKTITGINRIRQRLGEEAVAALMTSTARSLEQPEAIIDQYVQHGFRSIFLRYISPYGFAVRASKIIGYETDRFIEFFKRGLAHIIALNHQGTPIVEVYTQLLLRRILTVFPTGYVDLQSPSGAGLSAVVYNYNGGVYSSDEGRMLAEMGDETFRMGSVFDSYEDLFLSDKQLGMLFSTMSEGIPQCSTCALQPYCGTDPAFHYRTQGSLIGHRPSSAYCRRNMEIMRHLFLLLEDDPAAAKVLKSWI
jgi:uncharacterized protein